MATLLLLALTPRDAMACSVAGPGTHMLEPAEQAIDTQAPGTPTVTGLHIKRGRGPQRQGCGTSVSSCDDLGSVSFSVAATDDRTPVTQIGYRLTINRGRAPDALSPQQDSRPFEGGVFYLWWSDGTTDDQEDLDFDIEVRAVDLAGNVSAQAATVRVQDGLGGCRVAGRAPRSAISLAPVLLGTAAALALTRRRRRARR